MDTGLLTSTECSLIENGHYKTRKAFLAKLKSFEENDNLGTIREAVAIIEPPIEENVVENSDSMQKVSSHPDLLLTVSMPYGSYLGHELPPSCSKSQPNLQVTVSLSSLSKNSDKIATKMTSTSDLNEENTSDSEDDSSSIISSCSAGSNSSCSSSFDENCPHCVISVRTKATCTYNDEHPEVYL